jgi:hypothetical protein
MGALQMVCLLLVVIAGVQAILPRIPHSPQLPDSSGDTQGFTLKLKRSLTQPSQAFANNEITRRYLSNAMPVTGLDQYYGMRCSDSANM